VVVRTFVNSLVADDTDGAETARINCSQCSGSSAWADIVNSPRRVKEGARAAARQFNPDRLSHGLIPRASSRRRTESTGSGRTVPARLLTGVAMSMALYNASSVASVTA